MRNPFSLAFGKLPSTYIPRTRQIEAIKDTFLGGDTSNQAYIITGLRGIGKTVLLTEVAKQFSQESDCDVIDLNPNREMLTSLVSKMHSTHTLQQLFSRLGLSVHIPGFSVSHGGKETITDPEEALKSMLTAMQYKGRKLLVTIDEVDNNKDLKAFITTFQMMIRQDLPIYLLMTGMYKNVSDLQNARNMTFLLRTPKLELTSLNQTGMITTYMHTCGVSEGKACEMADQDLLGKICTKERYKVADLLSDASMSNSTYSVYRRRLADKGLIDISQRGYVSCTLPRLDIFIRNRLYV